ncbi:hypothetical protein SRB17_78590 [Streptomyces sp. RB17]|nr:hypothetical protein [Streptomyces sp. RB17]
MFAALRLFFTGSSGHICDHWQLDGEKFVTAVLAEVSDHQVTFLDFGRPAPMLLLHTDGIIEARDGQGRFHPLTERAQSPVEGVVRTRPPGASDGDRQGGIKAPSGTHT